MTVNNGVRKGADPDSLGAFAPLSRALKINRHLARTVLYRLRKFDSNLSTASDVIIHGGTVEQRVGRNPMLAGRVRLPVWRAWLRNELNKLFTFVCLCHRAV